MATVKSIESLGSTFLLIVDSDPSVGTGVNAPIGSTAYLENGYGAYFKYGSSDTNWRSISQTNNLQMFYNFN